MVPTASNRNKGESAGIRVLRSVITPFCQRKARPFPSISNDPPTTWPLLLMPMAALATSPGSVPKVGHHTILPEEGVKGCIAGQIRTTDYLTLVIDVNCNVAHRASEVAEVSNAALLPEQGVKTLSCAVARRARSFAAVVDRPSKSLGVAGECREFLDLSLCPNDRLKLEDLGSFADWV